MLDLWGGSSSASVALETWASRLNRQHGAVQFEGRFTVLGVVVALRNKGCHRPQKKDLC